MIADSTYKVEEYEKGIKIYNVHDFDTYHIFECGQCFRWLPCDNGGYRGIVGNKHAAVYYDAEKYELTIEGSSAEDFVNIWYNYFDLGTDYAEIKSKLSSKDKYLKASVNFGRGIRILNQEPFETLISFIISANNNIPRIRKCIAALSEKYGEPVTSENNIEGFAFPKPQILAGLTEQEVSDCCKAGYRCKYIIEASKRYTESPIDINMLRALSIPDARKVLLSYMGVGPKVADCILLFTGARRDAFPVDVWVARLMNELYLNGVSERKAIEAAAYEYFGEIAGLAQQYLFFYAREHFDELKNTI